MKSFLRKSAGYFLQGLLFITPIGVTVFVIVWFVNLLDDLFAPVFEGLLPYHIPGFGLLFAFFWLALLGYLIAHLVSRSAETWFDGLMKRAPLVKVIYFSVKDLITVFFGKEDKMGKPVKVLVQRDPAQYKFGFVTRHDMTDYKLSEEFISVYMPFSYGVMGNQMAVRKEDVEYLDLPSSEVMKFIVSGGVVQKNDADSSNTTK
ncbi:MAG: DUF502 domain-containing protein [Flavobacteriales bacterium]|nr:DUF502 domain-containing protein [Flavobacteriales bacterium]